MQKKTIGCALAAALLAAGAQAAGASVYGAVDLYAAVNNDSGRISSALSSGGSTGSYVGIQGSESLQSGVEAVYKLEAGFLADDGTLAQSFAGNTNRLFHRETWLGLRSQTWGQLSFGRQYTPHFLAWAMTDANGLSLGTAAGAFFFPGRIAAMGGDDPTQDDLVRRNNSIFYATPELAGFTGMLYAALGESSSQPGSSSAGNVYNFALNWRRGPLFLMGSVLYQDLAKTAVPLAAGGRDYAGRNVYWELAGTWDLSFTKLAAEFEFKRGQGTPEGPDFIIGQLGASTPVCGGRLNTTAAFLHDRDNDKADGYSFGVRYDYDLSKRTMVYVGAVALINEADAARSIEAGPDSSYHFEASAPGNDAQQLFVGMRHAF